VQFTSKAKLKKRVKHKRKGSERSQASPQVIRRKKRGYNVGREKRGGGDQKALKMLKQGRISSQQKGKIKDIESGET